MPRLDQLLLDLGLSTSLKEAASLIMAGKVLVDERPIDKAGTIISPDAEVRIRENLPFVSRGGLKLQGALHHFSIDPRGWICADIGASTGGFTDCLLQAGAEKVYAVDVAYGVLDWKVRSDSRVIPVERCNARNLSEKQIPDVLDLAVFDVSFISLTMVMLPIISLFGTGKKRILALIKPQFELPPAKIGKGGIVTKEPDRMQAVEKIIEFGVSQKLKSAGFIESPIKGAKGNQEYFLYLTG